MKKLLIAATVAASCYAPMAMAGWGDLLSAAANIANQSAGNNAGNEQAAAAIAAAAANLNAYGTVAANPATNKQGLAQALANQAQAMAKR